MPLSSAARLFVFIYLCIFGVWLCFFWWSWIHCSWVSGYFFSVALAYACCCIIVALFLVVRGRRYPSFWVLLPRFVRFVFTPWVEVVGGYYPPCLLVHMRLGPLLAPCRPPGVFLVGSFLPTVGVFTPPAFEWVFLAPLFRKQFWFPRLWPLPPWCSLHHRYCFSPKNLWPFCVSDIISP